MALTFRTGSDGIGRALTINELDDNFRSFTGSHSITGSLTVNGNIISFIINMKKRDSNWVPIILFYI